MHYLLLLYFQQIRLAKSTCPKTGKVKYHPPVAQFYNHANIFQGQFWSGCNRQYFVSSDQVQEQSWISHLNSKYEFSLQLNQQDAAEECCKYGLRLLSIETLDELACLAQMNTRNVKIKTESS
jgi:hypothetical protein